MREAVPSATRGAKLLALLVLCCLQITLISSLPNEALLKTEDNLQQPPQQPQQLHTMDDDAMSKRDWNKELHIWGKRAWNNIHGGWALKRNAPSWPDQSNEDKRAWQNLHQSGWGKRPDPATQEEEDRAMRQIAALLDQHAMMQQDGSDYTENNPIEDLVNEGDEGGISDNLNKRNWGQFHGGWGKRSKWDRFRGAWGKRDPAWSNLKGIWGKRADQ